MIPAGKNRFMLIVGFHMAVIMEDRALLFCKNGKYRKLCQYSQQLFLRELPAVLPVQMDLRRGDVVTLQHSPDCVPLLPHKMDELLPLCLGIQIGAESVEDRRCVMLGKVDVAHGLHGGVGIALRKVLCGEHHAASVDLLLQIRLEKFPRIGVKVLRADVNQIPRCSLPCHFCPLVHKAVDILPQTFPLGVGLGLRQMFDGQGVVQKEAEAEHPAVDEVVHIFAPGHKGIEGHALKKLPVQDHGAAEDKGRALEARPAADDLVKGPRLAAEAVPIGHPRLRAYIVIILTPTVQIVAGNAMHDVSVDSFAQKFK